MSIKVLFIGEIVGKAGVFCIKQLLPMLKAEHDIDFTIASCEGATGGFGIGKNHSIYLKKLGVDLLTSGEKIYFKLDMVPHIQHTHWILRPANYPYGNPGRGWTVADVGGVRLGVINLLGQSGFDRVHLSNPFTYVNELITRMKSESDAVIVDFHASTTAEKNTMFHHIDGKVAAVVGTHSKVMTADERVMPNGTAIITDVGRTGSSVSVGGLDQEVEIRKFLTSVPERSQDTWESLMLQGVIIEIGSDGKAKSIERIQVPSEGKQDD